MRRSAKFNPTFLQRQVLMSLASVREATLTDWTAWWPMHEQQVRNVVRGLERRGLVDVAGFDGRARTYKLTEKGHEFEAALGAEGEDR